MSRILEFLGMRLALRTTNGRQACSHSFAGARFRLGVVAALAAVLLCAFFVFSSAQGVAADPTGVSVFVRVVGPADEPTFGDTGEYVPVWSGDVLVPPEVTVTASSGKQYRLFVEAGTYKATRLSDSNTWPLGDGDDALGATSVLAALHEASVLGGFDYELSDAWFPGSGLYIDSIDGVSAHGAVGWAYRVFSGDVAPTPGVPVDRFMLGYEASEPPPPHTELVLFWGYGDACRPLRLQGPSGPVQCGEPVEFSVECYVDDGYSGSGTWQAAENGRVCVGDECCTTDSEGLARVTFQQTGEFPVVATKPHDGDYYYIPGDSMTVQAEGPCKIIAFSLVDSGEPGLDFGAAVHGTASIAEVAQSTEAGAVQLRIGPETNVPCSLRVKGIDVLSGAQSDSMPLDAIAWDTDSSAEGSTPLTDSFVEVGTAPDGVETTLDVWLWLSIPEEQTYGVYTSELVFTAVEQGT